MLQSIPVAQGPTGTRVPKFWHFLSIATIGSGNITP